MMRCFKKIIRRITTGRAYNDETDDAIRRSLLNEGSDLGPGECYHDLQRVILKNRNLMLRVMKSSRVPSSDRTSKE